MKIIQLLPSFSYGDAIGNHTLVIRDLIAEMGYATAIYAEVIDQRLPVGTAFSDKELPELSENDIAIYHYSTGSELNYLFGDLKCKKILIYHNITPGEFFGDYNKKARRACNEAREAGYYLADKVDYCIADSEYNKRELIEMGFKCPIEVVPILVAFQDFKQKPDRKVMHKFMDNKTNIVFMGRVAPNKKHEDIIRAFAEYKKYWNKDARLFLVGGYDEADLYYRRLKNYAEALGVKDVYFTAHIPFKSILAYYRIADVFLCQSEHEGFCVPLLEAMYFEVPIVAYDSSAIGDTLGGTGILLKEKDPVVTAGVLNRVVTDGALRKQMIEQQNLRLKDFNREDITKKLAKCLYEVMGSVV